MDSLSKGTTLRVRGQNTLSMCGHVTSLTRCRYTVKPVPPVQTLQGIMDRTPVMVLPGPPGALQGSQDSNR